MFICTENCLLLDFYLLQCPIKFTTDSKMYINAPAQLGESNSHLRAHSLKVLMIMTGFMLEETIILLQQVHGGERSARPYFVIAWITTFALFFSISGELIGFKSLKKSGWEHAGSNFIIFPALACLPSLRCFYLCRCSSFSTRFYILCFRRLGDKVSLKLLCGWFHSAIQAILIA